VCAGKKASRQSSGQVVFDSEGTVVGMGWKTLALYVGFSIFPILIAVFYFCFGLFSACI